MITIALPKGSLEAQTLQLFKEADLEVRRTDRDYNPKIDDPRIGKVKILRPQEIPTYVEKGYFDIGISGLDWVKETGSDVVEVAQLTYSKTGEGNVRIVIAVHRDEPVDSVAMIRPGSRVTTEYPSLTRRFFEEQKIPVQLFPSYGASEAKVPDLMDVVVDLTETGTTLRKNGLKIIGQIMESYTVIIANRSSYADPQKRREIDEITTLLFGVIAARNKVLLTMNVPSASMEKIIAALPAMKKPTVSRLHGIEYYSIQTVVPKSAVNQLIPRLKGCGAEDILEIPIAKIVP
ncbi:MAG TPA: ATP phosphoribosyltransferase [Methanoregulaceae archaeon]|nr:ATP phosphoribosyltransferase [Methanoregulaceae archaeon]HPD75763.1 ATP phosphoribosyltransferase [Methanoregulaceae archaeon]HRY75517.1 ATP phosphoribosyltransferase [Methanoregulaceae archaeon]